MTVIRLRRRLFKWGDAYGIRVTKEEMRKLEVEEQDFVQVKISVPEDGLDVEGFPTFHLGRDARRKHDEIAEEASDGGS